MSAFKVRQLTESDWFDFQKNRLESLAQHPEYFTRSIDETKLTSLQWKERLSNKNTLFFGLFYQSIFRTV